MKGKGRRMGGKTRLLRFAFATALLAAVGTQTAGQRKTSGLEFRLQPKAVEGGVPQAFSFLLVNTTGHEIRVRKPTIECEDSFSGSIWLRHFFKPLKPEPPSYEQGCAHDTQTGPPVMDRIKEWKILPKTLRIRSDMNLKEAVIAVAILPIASGQTNPAARPEFDVTSVKPRSGQGRTAYGTGNGRGYGKNVTLKLLIGLAWQVQQFQISGGPAWISSERFDIEGKTDNPKADFALLRLMMRSLLEDRYKLKLHPKTRESSVYQLIVAKGGPKIKLSSDQTSPDAVGPPTSAKDGPGHGSLLTGPGIIIGNAVPLAQFAKLLAPEVDHAVVDKTNLAGRFDIRLHWTPDTTALSGPSEQHPAGSSEYPSSIFTAIDEQLGLSLKSARGPVEFLIIDHCEKPTAN